MRIKFGKPEMIKLGCLLLLIAVSPFAVEFLVIADFVGVEFAVSFMLLYFRTAFYELVVRWWRFKKRFEDGILQISELVLFQPKPYGITSVATCTVIFVTGSTFVACALWLPAIAMSSGYLTGAI